MSKARYRIRPWRGMTTGRLYYNVERAGLFLWRTIVPCFTEQEANEMIVKLSCWDEGRPSPTTAPHDAQGGGAA